MKKQLKKIGTAVALSVLFLLGVTNNSKADCSFSTPSVGHADVGQSFEITITFHSDANNTQRIAIVNQTGFAPGSINCSANGVTDVDGVGQNPLYLTTVFPAASFDVNSGDHVFKVTGNIPVGTPCGSVATFDVRMDKKMAIGWNNNECNQTFVVTTFPGGSVGISGSTNICGNQIQNYSVTGTVANTYIWSTTNTTFKLNGSNAWPITTYSPNVTIQPTVAGSSATISLSATGSGFCGPATSSINIQSTYPAISISGNHGVCNEANTLGTNTIGLTATDIVGATYQWAMKLSSATTWTILSTTTSAIQLPGQSVIGTYNVRCQATKNGCVGNTATIDVRWCRPNLPGQLSCCYNPQKREISPDADQTAQNVYAVMPNPSNGIFQIESISEINAVKVFDLSGRLVKEFESLKGYNYSMDLSELKDGIYLIEVSGENYTEKQKIMKSN